MPDRDTPLLLTPGPLTTAEPTRAAMMRDWGSRDPAFIAMTADIRDRLLGLIGAKGSHACVPIQGSGTFAVEAMLGTLVPKSGRTLVLVNGAYGLRMVKILERMGREVVALRVPETGPFPPEAVAAALNQDETISHVAVVHCETTTGVLNPLAEIAKIVSREKRALLIDAMSSFGGIPIFGKELKFSGLAASSNKCLEAVPGMGFVIAEKRALAMARNNAPSLSLDLCDQWEGLERNGQWRFTPPTHVLAALASALDQLKAEGGPQGRHQRYSNNRDTLIRGMRDLGFELLLNERDQAPIIVTFKTPADPAFDFDAFYEALKVEGYVIYPGKLTEAETFRVGCIGAIQPADLEQFIQAVKAVMADQGIRTGQAAA